MASELLELRRKANSFNLEGKDESNETFLLEQHYFLAISTILKSKARYPLKTAGVAIYRKLEKVTQSLENTLLVCHSENLHFFYCSLQKLIVFLDEVQSLETIFAIIHKTASIMNRSYSNEQQAKKALQDYVFSLKDKREIVALFISKFQKNLRRWLPKIFTHITYPFLPNTNNELEFFNLKLKKLYRKITGRKNSHLFLFSSGVPLSFVLSSDRFNIPYSAYSSFSYCEIAAQKALLFQTAKKSLVFAIKNNLDEFLFNLEVMAYP